MLVLYVLMDLYLHVCFKESTLSNKEECGLREGEKLTRIDNSMIVSGGHL